MTLSNVGFDEAANVLHEGQVTGIADKDEFTTTIAQQSRQLGDGSTGDELIGILVILRRLWSASGARQCQERFNGYFSIVGFIEGGILEGDGG